MTLFVVRTSGAQARTGVAATRKLGSAVARNRAKRLAPLPAPTSSSCRGGRCSMHTSHGSRLTTWLYSGRIAPAGIPATPPSLAVGVLLCAIKGYKLLLSPLFSGYCRFHPSCSDYAAQAIHQHGALRGTWLSVRRLARCRPLGGHGFDPVPHS
jgi:putative membrane protein insertion efficiency factor